MSKLSSTSMDELETEQEMSDSAVTVECRLAYDQDTALQRLHRNRSTDDQLDTENGQTWVVQKLKMSENNSEVNIEEVVCNKFVNSSISSLRFANSSLLLSPDLKMLFKDKPKKRKLVISQDTSCSNCQTFVTSL